MNLLEVPLSAFSSLRHETCKPRERKRERAVWRPRDRAEPLHTRPCPKSLYSRSLLCASLRQARRRSKTITENGSTQGKRPRQPRKRRPHRRGHRQLRLKSARSKAHNHLSLFLFAERTSLFSSPRPIRSRPAPEKTLVSMLCVLPRSPGLFRCLTSTHSQLAMAKPRAGSSSSSSMGRRSSSSARA
jgi:hypothetical protein